MSTIQLQVSERMIQNVGLEALERRLYRFLEIEEWRLAALHVQNTVEKAALDQNAIWEEARSVAWEEFKVSRPNLFP